ncbi:unnamed protein product, partial [Chrysoparadoxa australica]
MERERWLDHAGVCLASGETKEALSSFTRALHQQGESLRSHSLSQWHTPPSLNSGLDSHYDSVTASNMENLISRAESLTKSLGRRRETRSIRADLNRVWKDVRETKDMVDIAIKQAASASASPLVLQHSCAHSPAAAALPCHCAHDGNGAAQGHFCPGSPTCRSPAPVFTAPEPRGGQCTVSRSNLQRMSKSARCQSPGCSPQRVRRPCSPYRTRKRSTPQQTHRSSPQRTRRSSPQRTCGRRPQRTRRCSPSRRETPTLRHRRGHTLAEEVHDGEGSLSRSLENWDEESSLLSLQEMQAAGVRRAGT